MAIAKNIFAGSMAAALLSLGIVAGVQGQGPSGVPGSFGGELRGITQFTGRVVCVGCNLEETRQAQPNLSDLYQLNYEQGRVVMQVDSFSDSAEHRRWESIVGLSHQLHARATDEVLKALTAEENLFKPMTVTGLLRSTRTLDIDSVKVEG
jgi:hypothetical protein